MMFCLELVHLKGKKISGRAYKTTSWYLIGFFSKVADEQIYAPRESPGGYCMNKTDINDIHYEEVSNITLSVSHYQLLSRDYLYLLHDCEIANANLKTND